MSAPFELTRVVHIVAWATRTLITRKLKGLDEIIRTSQHCSIRSLCAKKKKSRSNTTVRRTQLSPWFLPAWASRGGLSRVLTNSPPRTLIRFTARRTSKICISRPIQITAEGPPSSRRPAARGSVSHNPYIGSLSPCFGTRKTRRS